MSEPVPEFREHTGHAPDSPEDTPVIAQYSGVGVRGVVRNEVRGHVSGAVVQIAGDQHGGIQL